MSLDSLPTLALVAGIGVLVLFSAYFSGTETAMMALNRYRLRHLVREGHAAARRAHRLLQRPDRLLGVILLGNNLVNFLAASLATVIGLRLLGDLGVAIAPVALTIVFLVFAEVAPKTIAAQFPERIAFPSTYVLGPLLRLLYPVVWLLNTASNALLLPLQGGRDATHDRLSVEELRTVLHESARLPIRRQNMLLGILDLEHVTVDDIMVPREEIVGIDLDDDMSEILATLRSAQHTRLPIYRGNVNNVEGILHLRNVARLVGLQNPTKSDLQRLAREPYFVPQGTPLHTQLVNFQNNQRRIGIDQVDRIKATAQTHLEDGKVELGPCERQKGGQGAKLEIGQRDLAPCLLDLGKDLTQGTVCDLLTVDADAFVVMQQMGGGEQTIAIACLTSDGIEHGGTGALAVGTGDADHHAGE